MKLKLSEYRLWTVDSTLGLPLFEDDQGNLYRARGAAFDRREFEVDDRCPHTERKLLCVTSHGYGFMSDVRFII